MVHTRKSRARKRRRDARRKPKTRRTRRRVTTLGTIDLRGARIGEVRGPQSISTPLQSFPRRRTTRRRPKSKALRLLTSPKTTLALLGTLAAIPFGAAALAGRAAVGVGARVVGKKAVTGLGRGAVGLVKGTGKAIAKRPILSLVGAGVLVTSPTARRAAVTLPQTLFSGGKTIGGKIEGLSAPTKEKAGKFGLLGLGAAALLGGVLVAPTALRAAKGLIPSLPKRKKATQELPVGLLPAPPSITPTTQPLGAVQQVVEPTPSLPVEKVKPMKITNTFNPTIDIRFSKSRRFINQQIIVK